MKMPWLFGATLALICGLTFFMFSGRAEGFVSPRSIAIMPLLLLNVILVGAVFRILLRVFTKRYRSLTKSSKIAFAAIVIADVLLFGGRHIDNSRIEETKARGDKIHAAIKEFEITKGRSPNSLDELSSTGFVVPVPALKGSQFRYSPGRPLSFESVAFMICERKEGWICDD